MDWTIGVVKFTRGNLQRQSLEGHLIASTRGVTLLNRKGEWGQNLPPKLEVDSEGPKQGPKRRRDNSPTAPEQASQRRGPKRGSPPPSNPDEEMPSNPEDRAAQQDVTAQQDAQEAPELREAQQEVPDQQDAQQAPEDGAAQQDAQQAHAQQDGPEMPPGQSQPSAETAQDTTQDCPAADDQQEVPEVSAAQQESTEENAQQNGPENQELEAPSNVQPCRKSRILYDGRMMVKYMKELAEKANQTIAEPPKPRPRRAIIPQRNKLNNYFTSIPAKCNYPEVNMRPNCDDDPTIKGDKSPQKEIQIIPHSASTHKEVQPRGTEFH